MCVCVHLRFLDIFVARMLKLLFRISLTIEFLVFPIHVFDFKTFKYFLVAIENKIDAFIERRCLLQSKSFFPFFERK